MLNLPISTGTEFSIRWSSGVDQSRRSSEIVPYYTVLGLKSETIRKGRLARYIVQHYYLTSVCLQTAIKKRAISSYTVSDDHVPSGLIVAKHVHIFVPYYRDSCHSHTSTYGAPASTFPHIRRRRLPLVEGSHHAPSVVCIHVTHSCHCPTTTSPTLPNLIPHRNQPIEQLIPLLQRRHPILLATLINNHNPILDLPVCRPPDNNPSLPT